MLHACDRTSETVMSIYRDQHPVSGKAFCEASFFFFFFSSLHGSSSAGDRKSQVEIDHSLYPGRDFCKKAFKTYSGCLRTCILGVKSTPVGILYVLQRPLLFFFFLNMPKRFISEGEEKYHR